MAVSASVSTFIDATISLKPALSSYDLPKSLAGLRGPETSISSRLISNPISLAIRCPTTFRQPASAASTYSTGFAPRSSPPRFGGSSTIIVKPLALTETLAGLSETALILKFASGIYITSYLLYLSQILYDGRRDFALSRYYYSVYFVLTFTMND